MTCPICPHKLNERLAEHVILGGLPVGKDILWCATEMNTKREIDELVLLVEKIVKEEG